MGEKARLREGVTENGLKGKREYGRVGKGTGKRGR